MKLAIGMLTSLMLGSSAFAFSDQGQVILSKDLNSSSQPFFGKPNSGAPQPPPNAEAPSNSPGPIIPDSASHGHS